ncbi:sensor histidine kinase [Dyadobacter fanqingshengii]|uniref:Histidine kinase n=1 Tax=Dyadobacter fanqingshengii TaxID=2906443 RepID=A0A9X1P7Q9_9BACT|nr:histidine kinase [Dyadobacter fanqingshengii]MCF0038738.1 histidine kinase [Dyadobacter fanqingshengii]USJ34432.1 histidine kinase [Dyadobacter fanqingshengii]
MIRTYRFQHIGQLIWLSLFGRWMFVLLVPWFVPTISFLLIGDPYFASVSNFILGTLMVLSMTILAFVPHDWAAQYIAQKYPSIHSSLKRAAYTALAFCILTGVYITVYGLFIIRFRPLNAQLDAEKMVNVYLFELLAVLLLTCLYEVNYSLRKWKEIKINKEAIKKAGLQGQLQSLKSQVNPHFLFNSLNTLSALINDEPARAEQFVDEMAKVYRYLLQTNQHELTTLATEIRFIKSYYHLLRTRHDTGLELVINVSDSAQNKYIPPLTLQLLVENAVKHNTILEKKPLLIEITSLENDQLEVRNNLLEKSTRVKSTKLGLANIEAKYKLLSDRQPVIDLSADHFTVLLPLLMQNSENQ